MTGRDARRPNLPSRVAAAASNRDASKPVEPLDDAVAMSRQRRCYSYRNLSPKRSGHFRTRSAKAVRRAGSVLKSSISSSERRTRMVYRPPPPATTSMKWLFVASSYSTENISSWLTWSVCTVIHFNVELLTFKCLLEVTSFMIFRCMCLGHLSGLVFVKRAAGFQQLILGQCGYSAHQGQSGSGASISEALKSCGSLQ